MLTSVSQAAEWSVRPRIDTKVEWNDNRRLQQDPGDSTFGLVTRLRLNAAVRNERGSLSLRPQLTNRRFSNQKQLDTDDQALTVKSNYALSERLGFAFSGLYRRDTSAQLRIDTINVEDPEEEPLPGDDVDDDTSQEAVIQVGSRRRRFEANPSISYAATERLSLGLAYSFTDLMYSNGLTLPSPLSDFRRNRLTGSASYALSPKDTLTGSVFGERYEADIPVSTTSTRRSTTDSVGGSARYTRRFSPTFQAYAGAGLYQSYFDLEFVPGSLPLAADSDTGLLANVGFAKDFELGKLTGSYSRTLSPSSSGNLRQRDQVQLGYRHRLSQTLRGKINFRAYRTEGTSSNDRTSTTEVYRVSVGLAKRLNRHWRVTADYRFLTRDQERSATATSVGQDTSVDSHAVFIGVVYDGDRYAISR